MYQALQKESIHNIMSKFQKDLTKGSVSKKLILFSLPFVLSNMIQSIYSVADLYIVGQFNGSASIAGVNLGGQITMFITNLAFGLVTGGTVLLAQYIGAKKQEDVEETIGTMFTVMFILAVSMTVIMIAGRDVVLKLINTPEEAFTEARSYFTICMLGTVFIFGYNVISAILRSMGDSRNPLLFVSIACVVNVVLDYIFVGIFDMKAAGAAYATIIAQGLSLIISVIYLIKHDFVFKFKLKNFKPKSNKVKRLLSIGIPTSIQNSISSLSFLIIASLVNEYGVKAAAGVGIVGKINSFAIMPAFAMSMSVSAMAGQNIGAGMYDRAKKTLGTGIKIALLIGTVIFIFIQLFPDAILEIFDKDSDTIRYGVQYIRVFSFDYLIVPFAFCCNGLITGSGNTLYVAATTITTSIVLRAPLAYILGTVCGLGLTGIGLAVPFSSLGTLILGLIFITKGKWKNKRIV